MEYKRSYAGEIIAIAFIIILVIITITMILAPEKRGDSQQDYINQLQDESREDKLNEKPMTVEEADKAFGVSDGFENETAEERQARLQRFVDEHNKNLESEQNSIRERKNEYENRNNQFIMIMLIGGGVAVVVLGISALAKANQPPALTISDQTVTIKPKVFSNLTELDLSTIHQIQYKIINHRTSKARYTERKLYFKDRNGNTVGDIDLKELSDANFNTIYKEISQRAPHIEWIYPD